MTKTRLSRRQFFQRGATLGAAAMSWPLMSACAGSSSTAQSRRRRIALLSVATGTQQDILYPDLMKGLQALGYAEGKNFLLDLVFAGSDIDRFAALAAELISRQPEVIIAEGAPVANVLMKLTPDIPIVALMPLISDPVGSGFAKSEAHPGGNLTGIVGDGPEVWSKRAQLLKEVVPSIRRVAVPWNSLRMLPFSQVQDEFLHSTLDLGITPVPLEVPSHQAMEAAFNQIPSLQIDALAWDGTINISSDHKQVAELTLKAGLPSISNIPAFPRLGGLLSYSGSQVNWGARTAAMVDSILRGTPVGDIPIERPTAYDFVVSLKTAAALGITIPNSVLLQATVVISA